MFLLAKTYQLNQTEPFKLSRSKIELFTKCPYCFYLDRRLGISQPSGPAFSLNLAVDALLKSECDDYRAQKCPHPLAIENHLDAIPYQTKPIELIDTWRNNFIGISFLHETTNFLVYGAIDDIWVTPKGEVIVIDYKATAKAGEIVLDQDYHEAYKRQLEIYAWLLLMNGYTIYDKAYFVYTNGIKDAEKFEECLHFKTKLIEHTLNTNWIEKKLQEAFDCLNQPFPPKRTEKTTENECKFCEYLNKVEKL
jgi:RecB family exonuclease